MSFGIRYVHPASVYPGKPRITEQATQMVVSLAMRHLGETVQVASSFRSDGGMALGKHAPPAKVTKRPWIWRWDAPISTVLLSGDRPEIRIGMYLCKKGMYRSCCPPRASAWGDVKAVAAVNKATNKMSNLHSFSTKHHVCQGPS